MRSLLEILKEKPTFSFELFPPKTEEGHSNLLLTIKQLAELKPDFFSCTYGAGGGSRDKTFEIVQHIQDNSNIPAVAHLTCVCHTKKEIKMILKNAEDRNICNILALRGDPPKDNPNWTPGPENFRYACELVEFIRQHFGDYFGIGVAGFPEGHILAPSKDDDAKILKLKIDSGANFVITQLFFDNQLYFDYVSRLRALGVTKRIIPGILPITNYQGLIRFCQSCGATVPQKVHDIFQPIQDDKDATLEAGIRFAVQQCKELLAGGAPGLHFYTLNKINPVTQILQAVKS